MKKVNFLVLSVFGISAVFSGCKTHLAARHPSSMDDSMDSEMNMQMGDVGPAPVCKSPSDTISDEQIAVINSFVSSRSHRLKHALWHATRGGLTATEEKQVVTAFGQSWGQFSSPNPSQFHPLCPAPGKDATATDYNPAGEDFLFMHRDMVNMLRAQFIAKGLPCISGWTHVPTVAEWKLADNDTSGPKSDAALAQLTAWNSTFQDPNWLSTVSLSQVGWALEFTIHNNLHMRYATTQPPAGFPQATKTGGAQIPFSGTFPKNWQYDKPAYDWLADPYGAAVNPVFWKIHGYVDSMIDAWLKANHYTTIASDCGGAKGCYQWRGTWTGEITSNVGKALGVSNESAAQDIDAILNKKRMRAQQIGVLNDEDSFTSASAMKATAPQQDPLQFTESKLCTK